MRKINIKIIQLLLIILTMYSSINNIFAVEMVNDPNIFQNVSAVIIEDKGIKNVENDYQDGVASREQTFIIEVLNGEKKGKQYEAKYSVMAPEGGNFQFDILKVGDKVYATIDDRQEQPSIHISGIQRHNSLIYLGIIFLLAIIFIGKKQGIKTVISLALTVVIIFAWALPKIVSGSSPIAISIIVAVLITVITYIIISGFHKKTMASMVGTVGGVLVAGIIVIIFGKLARLSGLNEESMYLAFLPNGVKFNLVEIIFAGIIIGALGACMDVAMSIASSLEEIKKESPEITRKGLFKSGMNIGKDVMGTMTNTLILAYVGSSLTILILYLGYSMSFTQIVNIEIVTEAIIRSLSGSIGLIAVIPITAFISSYMYAADDRKVKDKVFEEQRLD